MTKTALVDHVADRSVVDVDSIFLKPHVKMELLLGRWLAWPHLISPAQHAMNICFRHLPIMQSFVSNPQAHLAASKDRKLFGGPFMDLPKSALPEISRLIHETLAQCADLIAFANDFKSFDRAVQAGATGYCLFDFFGKIPHSLAGAIEICYDLNNHPLLRLIEEVIYRDRLDNRSVQELHLSHIKDSERKFFMSTPRLPDEQSYFKKMEFSDPRLDLLSRMRTQPAALADVYRAFDIGESNKALFESFFTSKAPTRKEPSYEGAGVRVRYFGHACVLIQTERNSILIDPTVTWDDDDADERFTFCDLPDVIDLLVISHAHQDHFSPEILVQLRQRVRRAVVPRNNAGNIADPSMKLIMKRLGYTTVDVVDPFDAIKFDEGEIVSLPFSGEHADLDIHSKQTILVDIKGKRFFFLVDCDAINPALYKAVAMITGRVDAAFVGMECYGAPLTWLYGPLLTKPISRRDDESRRLSASNCERAWRLIKEMNCPEVFIYAMGQEPWMRYLMGLEYQPGAIQLQQVSSFMARCREAGVKVQQLNVAWEMLF